MRSPLSSQEIEEALRDLDGWQFEEDQLTRSLEFDDFRSALAFIVRLAFEAEELNHHPMLTNVYNKVDIALNTHDAGGKVTEMDLKLARRIEELMSPWR